jgi:hypothetical protein
VSLLATVDGFIELASTLDRDELVEWIEEIIVWKHELELLRGDTYKTHSHPPVDIAQRLIALNEIITRSHAIYGYDPDGELRVWTLT